MNQTAELPWFIDMYEGICRSNGPPKEGFFRITIPRRQRATAKRQFKAARLFRPVPLDPDTGEILDRYPPLAGEINGSPADYRLVWATGEPIDKDEYKWLMCLNAIRN